MTKDYLSVSYAETKIPFTTYPAKLSNYLVKTYGLSKDSRLIEFGPGRCEIAKNFKLSGLHVTCIDNSIEAKNYAEKNLLNFIIHDLNSNVPFPLSDSSFDIVFCKSLIEHLENPEFFIKECFRVLKVGGKILILTPDWEANYKIFFDDFTHIKPFTKVSLSQLLETHNFSKINVIRFRQLPSTWNSKIINLISKIIAPISPIRSRIKFVRWSKELMLIGFAIKS